MSPLPGTDPLESNLFAPPPVNDRSLGIAAFHRYEFEGQLGVLLLPFVVSPRTGEMRQ